MGRRGLGASRHTFLTMRLHLALMLVVALVGSGVSVIGYSAPAMAANAIQTENSLPGDPTWDDFASVSTQDAINGYGSKISVNHGDSIDFFVTTTAASFTIDIFRTGWYGGVGARKMTSLGTFTGVHQPACTTDSVTGMVDCSNWSKTTTLNVPSTWVTGAYLAKLKASSGNASYIFFVVRDDGGTEAIEFQTSVTTYQAYNAYGGISLYTNNTNGSVYKYAHATKVSFDRPFDPNDSNGAGHFLYVEYPFIRWAESQGYDLTYTTDVDTHTNANPLTNHKAFLSVGHDEYWSKPMRDNVQNAINAGVNVGFFGANDMYWQIRFEANKAGAPNRVEVGYKDTAIYNTAPGPDPMYGVNNAIVTTNWRDTPVNLPENAVIGVMYDGQVPNNNYAYVVQNASNWVYAGSGFSNGSSVAGIDGYEYDKVWNNGYSPAGLTILSNSPICCSDTQWDSSNNTYSNSTIYTAASGARVFAAGTIDWSWGLDNYSSGNTANAGIQKTTANILNNFISGAAPAAPAVTLAPTSLTFPSQTTGTTSTAQTVTLSNSGSAALTITGISLGGTNAADFAQSTTCPSGSSTLAAGASCTISVTFSPAATGTRTASLSISDNASGSPQSVGLSGTGAAPPAPGVSFSPSSLSFGNQLVGTTSSAQTATLTNNGNASLAITSISVSGTNAGDFGQTNTCPSSLAAGANCTISVSFSPTATGSRAASLAVADNASGSPQTVGLSGSGTAPAVTLSPSSLTFASQQTGTKSAAQTVTLTNSGTGPLTISSIGISGTNTADFAQSTSCPSSASTLAAGAKCTISVTFTPATAGTRTASLSITDNASGSPQSVNLSGTGSTTSNQIFSDGFESGTLPGAWTKTTVSSGNSVTIDTSRVHSGSDSLKAVQAKGSAGNAEISKSITGQTTLDVRGYYYLSSPVNWGNVPIMSLYAQGNFIGWLAYYVDPSSPTLSVYNGANGASYNCTMPSLNAWHSLEVQVVLSTTTTGAFTVWLDGVKACGASNISTSPASGLTVDQVVVGVDGADNTVGLTVNVDDVVISKSYIGP